MKKTKCLYLALPLLVFFLQGCATTPTIGYETKSPRQASKHAAIYFEAFEDGRSQGEQGILGGLYNGYNMRMGNVMEPPGMINSLKKTLQSELSAAGYDLIEDPKDLAIKATLISLTCDLRLSSEASMNLRVVLNDKGGEVFSKTYRSKASVFKFIGQDCSGAINKALKDIAGQLIHDLNEYIQT